MKPILSLLLVILFAGISYSQEKEEEGKYDRFRTGKFTYTGENKGAIIIRTKNKQTEIYPDGKSKIVMKIKWTSDSTYVLTFIKSDIDGCLEKGDWIKVELINEDGDRFTGRCSSEKCGGGIIPFVKLE